MPRLDSEPGDSVQWVPPKEALFNEWLPGILVFLAVVGAVVGVINTNLPSSTAKLNLVAQGSVPALVLPCEAAASADPQADSFLTCHPTALGNDLVVEFFRSDAAAGASIESVARSVHAGTEGSCAQRYSVMQTYYVGSDHQVGGKLLCYIDQYNHLWYVWTSLGYHRLSSMVSTTVNWEAMQKAWQTYRANRHLHRLKFTSPQL